MDRFGASPGAGRKRRREGAGEKQRASSPTVDADHQRRNPTRYVPIQPGFLSLGRAETKQDLRDSTTNASLGGGGAATFAKETDGVMSTECHKMETTHAPVPPAGAAIGIKTLRLQRWLRHPARAEGELKRCEDQVAQLRGDLTRATQQQTQGEENYLALREHQFLLLQMLREADQGHDVYSEEMRKACLNLRTPEADPTKRRGSDAQPSSSYDPRGSEGKMLLEAAVRLGQGVAGLRSELTALDDEEARLLVKLGQNCAASSPSSRRTAADGALDNTSFWNDGTKMLPAVGDFVDTAYGLGFVTKLRLWDGLRKLPTPMAEVELPYGRGILGAHALCGQIRNPGSLDDGTLVSKWQKHRRLAEVPDVDSIANMQTESYAALTMDDLGLPFEADDERAQLAAARTAMRMAWDTADQILPDAKRLRRSGNGTPGAGAGLRAILQRFGSDAASSRAGTPVFGVGSEGSEAPEAESESDADLGLAARPRRRRPGRSGEGPAAPSIGNGLEKDETEKDSADGADGTDTRAGVDGAGRNPDEQMLRCRERLFPLHAALLPRDILPTGRSRLALQRLPLCGIDDVSGGAKPPVLEEIAYGGVEAAPGEGCASVAEYVERLNPELRELHDKCLEAYHFRAELARENARRNLLPRLFQPPTLKRAFDIGQRKAETLETCMKELMATVCRSESLAPPSAAEEEATAGTLLIRIQNNVVTGTTSPQNVGVSGPVTP